MNRALLNKEVQEFIESHYREDTSKMAFQGSPFEEVSTQELLVQLSGKKKAEKKLPTWFSGKNILYPPNINLEQTSSEITADYKASLVSGSSIIDITGGFGIDSFAFSKQIEKVLHFEMNEELQEIASHNFGTLGARNVISKAGDGIAFLEKTSEVFDWIYVDPSRRSDTGGRIFFLSHCQPNVPENLKLLLQKAQKLLIKTSPLLDIQAGFREIENVQEIHIVAVENDVKELLWILGANASEEIKVKTVNFQKTDKQVFESTLSSLDLNEEYIQPQEYLYEPNAAIMKSGLFAALGNELNLQKLHPNTQLFSSKKLINFPGRRFKILEVLAYKKKDLKKRFGSAKANISLRNFPEKVENIRKILKIKDGGNQYLFFTTLVDGEKAVLLCEKAD